MEEQKDILILAIESSCDETAASVVKNGREVLSNVISSQIELHKLYGGVVPEIASRKHIEKINQVIEEALAEANVTLDDLDAIGVTYGPGLVGALLVGVAEAKAIAYAKHLPLVGVHHIEGHISANYIENQLLVGEIQILSNGEVYATLSVDPTASVRDALRNPTFNLKTDIFDKKLNKIPHFDLIYEYIITHNLQNVIVEFALFDKKVGIRKERIIVYELRTHY